MILRAHLVLEEVCGYRDSDDSPDESEPVLDGCGVRLETWPCSIVRLHDDNHYVEDSPDSNTSDDLVTDDLRGTGARRKGIEETTRNGSQGSSHRDARPEVALSFSELADDYDRWTHH